jgi:hypothetical protein
MRSGRAQPHAEFGNRRVTWQAAQKHKLNFYFEDQSRDYDWVHQPVAPESNQHWIFPRLWVASTKYSAPLTNRLLLEGGLTRRTEDIWDPHPPEGDPFRGLISVVEEREQQLRGLAAAHRHPGRPPVQAERPVRLLMDGWSPIDSRIWP